MYPRYTPILVPKGQPLCPDKNYTMYDPPIPLWDMYLEETNLERYMHPSVRSSTVYSKQSTEAPKCPTNEWITTTGHMHSGLLLGHKKEQNKAICSNMDGHTDDYTK